MFASFASKIPNTELWLYLQSVFDFSALHALIIILAKHSYFLLVYFIKNLEKPYGTQSYLMKNLSYPKEPKDVLKNPKNTYGMLKKTRNPKKSHGTKTLKKQREP